MRDMLWEGLGLRGAVLWGWAGSGKKLCRVGDGRHSPWGAMMCGTCCEGVGGDQA